MKYRPFLRPLAPVILGAAAAIAGCSTTPPPAPTARAPVTAPPIRATVTAPTVQAPPVVAAAPRTAQPAPNMVIKTSNANNPRAYRTDAASHLYALNKERIYKGRMPPLLYAVGVLQVEVDEQGQVRNVSWMRAPKHAPEVMAEIEKTVRSAAPFPAPAKMGKVVYTDTWLWHKSGRFQLDTLTEGQD